MGIDMGPKGKNHSMTGMEWALLIALSMLWGGSFFFVGVAVTDFPPFTIVALRVTMASLALLAVMAIMNIELPRRGRIWAALFVMGFLNNVVPFSLIVWGQTHIASGVASILNATTPLFTVLVAHFLTADEKMTVGRILGVFLGLAGVAVMVGTAVVQSLGTDVLAQVAILGAALSYAFAGVFGRCFKAMGVAPLATAAGQVTASSILLLPVMLIVDKPWTFAAPSGEAVGALLGLAGLSTALAYVLYFRILATAGATNLLLVTLLIPVSAILLGIVFLGEVLEWKHIVGLTLIGIGLGAIDGRPWSALQRRLRPRRGQPTRNLYGDGI